MELEDGVFYQASYDGTEVAITADYPGLLPASHVSNQETSPPKELPHSTSPTALSHAPKGRGSARHAIPGATPKRAAPTPGKLRESWIGGVWMAGLSPLAELLDYEDTRFKTSSRVRVGTLLCMEGMLGNLDI